MLRRISTGVICLGSSWVSSGPNWTPTPSSLWQETQVATWNICRPLPWERPPSVVIC